MLDPAQVRPLKRGLAALGLLFLAEGARAAQQNPLDNFCRRHGHQTTVIDDKLYIDGGYVDFTSYPSDPRDYPNTWLGYHDLDNLTTTSEAWPVLNLSPHKDPNVIPTVHGGVLWGDTVNKRFYVFGGADTSGPRATDFTLLSYDTAYDKWDDFGTPKLTATLNISSYGAGVGISQTGQGYYYGGWIGNDTMKGWGPNKTMSSSFYKFEYDTNKTSSPNPPDKLPRAEGAMTWIPAGDTGLLVYMGGLVDPYGNGTRAPQPLDTIFLFDPTSNSWFTQKATGQIPQNRRQHCIDAAWAPDRSSYNIYLWGGASVPPPDVNVSAFSDIYILTLPSFVWMKVFPDSPGNGTYENGHYSSSCNMIKGNSQMFVIGGVYPDSDICDLNSEYWALHNLFTGTKGNTGTDSAYWAPFDPNVTSNVVPDDVYNVVGGDKNGGATVLAPKAGFDTPNGGLQTLIARKPTLPVRTATRSLPGSATSTATSSPDAGASGGLSTGAIVGIAVGGAAALGLVLAAWCVMGRRVVRRREERRETQRRQSHATQVSHLVPSTMSPHSPQGGWSPVMQEPFISPPGTAQHQHHHHPHHFSSPPGSQLTFMSHQPPAELEEQRGVSPGSGGVVSELQVGKVDNNPSPPYTDAPSGVKGPSPSQSPLGS